MSSDRVALRVNGISKAYRITTAQRGTERPTLMIEALRNALRNPLSRTRKEMFWALKDLHFEIRQGEAVGIIGRNGAGKSTFLKILSRVTTPTTGEIQVYGRVGSLLEVGTGFHAELTGRENIYLNGAILGMRKSEIRRAFDSIVEFAQIDRFLDTPVKRYSSGMYVRLAFAVAAHLRSEILVVDEVMAVGDADFQKKCIGKMAEVSTEEGRTVLFVSHQMVAVQAFCKRTIHLREGRVQFDGPTPEAIEDYLRSRNDVPEERAGVFDLTGAQRSGRTKHPVLRRVEVRGESGHPTGSLLMGEDLSLVIDVDGLEIPKQYIVILVKTDTDVKALYFNTLMKPPELFDPKSSQDRVVLTFPRLPLSPGRYRIELVVAEGGISMKSTVDRVDGAASFEVKPADVFGTGYQINGLPGGALAFVNPEWQVHSDGLAARATRSLGN